MTIRANEIADDLVLEGYPDQSVAFFKEIDARMHNEFPDAFGNKNRRKATTVEDSGEKLRESSKERTYENLPPEAKAACDNFVKTIPNFKQEDYVATYDWESE